MARQLEVNLSFTADSAKAKAQIQDLQNSLNNLMKKNNPAGKANLPVTEEILKAQQAAAQLSISLKNATDVNTGKLNLTQFSSELQKSNMTLEDYRKQFKELGPEGEKTFLNLAKSVMTADSAIKNSNKLVNDLWISLKNTAKWQLSSSIVKGFMGAISTAFNYAEDLNKSLNQIQIVTGNSAEQMARFAKQANIAAKELSTTTTAYTDASLIYYQQGLDDASVKERTDITIKAANAAGTNAEEMADYLTAVWNSYKVGSGELERYVDIMAALGAGTATSLEEISTAMEKVASVGEATGVKFEQMSSIIATVSSVTRQSAETVGTAFKTIFARMADLKLKGSVEEDGVTTTLGTVSEKLAQVGVNILDANGELRDMGDVTEELMGKWGTMNKATQQAVAIAVAGKRQYTQLLALMNNQDMYKDAMNMATGAEGTLQEQADTYAKSWEAAQKRVKAAAQGIYDSLINDDFFIGLNDSIAGVLGLIEKLIDSMGGFSGVLSGLGMLAFKVFDKQINESLQKSIQSMYSMSAAGKHQNDLLRQQAVNQVKAVYADRSSGNLNTYEQTDLDIQQNRFDLQTQLMNNAKMMSEDEIKLAQVALDTNKAYAERATTLAQIQTELEEQFNENKENAQLDIIDNFDFDWDTGDQKVAEFDELIQKYKEGSLEIRQAFQFNEAETDIFQIDDALKQLFDSAEGGAKIQLRDLKIEVNSLVDEFTSGSISEEEYTKKLEELKSKIASVAKSMNTSRKTFIEKAEAMGVLKEQAERLADIIPQLKKAEDNTATATENFNKSCQNLIQGLERTKTTTAIFAEGLLGTMRAISSLGMALSTLKGAWNTLNDPDMSGFEKVLSIMTSLGMGIPALVSSINLFRESWHGVAEGLGKVVTATAGAIAAQTAQKVVTDASTASTAAQMTAEELAIAVEKEKQAAEGLSMKQKLLYIAAQKLGITATAQEVVEDSKAIFAKIAHTAATGGLTIGQRLLAAATALVNVQLKTFWTLIWPIGAVVLGVAAAVTILVKAFEAVKNATPEAKLEKATEEANKAKAAFEETSKTVDELKTTLKSIDESYKQIEKMTKGTDEWKEKIAETNQELSTLLEQYENIDLYGTGQKGIKYEIDEQSGLIKITEEDLANIYKYENTAKKVQELNMNMQKSDQLTAQLNVKKEDFRYNKAIDTDASLNLTPTYGLGHDTVSLFSEQELDNIIKFLSEQENQNSIFNKNAQEISAQLSITEEQAQALKNYKGDILEMSSLYTQANQEYLKGYASLLSSTASELGSVLNTEEKLGSSIEDLVNARKKDFFKEGSEIQTTDEIQKYLDTYAQNFLGKDYEYKRNSGWSGDTIKFVQKDENGKEIEDSIREISRDEINTSLASLDLIKDLPQIIFDSAKNSIENALINYQNSLSQSTQEFISSFSLDINDEDIIKLSNSLQGFKDILGEDIGENKFAELALSLTDLEYSYDDIAEKVSNIDWTNLDVQNVTQGFQEGKYSAEEFIEKVEELNQLQILEGMSKDLEGMAEEFDLDSDSLKGYARNLMDVAEESDMVDDSLKKNAKAATDSAIQIEKMNKGIEDLADGFEDWESILRKSDKSSQEYSDAIQEMRSAVSNLLGVSEDYISRNFLEQNLDDLKLAAEGSAEAIDRLGQALAKDILKESIELNFNLSGDELNEKVNSLWQELQGQIDSLGSLQIGFDTSMDPEAYASFIASCNDIINQAGLTVEQANELFGAMGFTAVYASESQDNTVRVPVYEKHHERTNLQYSDDPTHPNELIGWTEKEYVTQEGVEEVPGDSIVGSLAINPNGGTGEITKPKIESLTYTGGGKANNYSSANKGGTTSPKKSSGGSGNKGGGSKSPQKSKKPQKTDVKDLDEAVTRYKDTDNLLESIERKLNKVQSKKDQVWGKKYIAAIDEENGLLNEQLGILDDQIKEAENYRNMDLSFLTSAGIEVELDENGFIKNFKQIEIAINEMEKEAAAAYDTVVNSAGEDADTSDAQELYKTQKDNIEKIKNKLNSYEDAVNKYYDDTEKREEILQQIRENNYDAINKKLEIQMDLLDREREHMEFLRNTFREGFFGIADNLENDKAQFGNLTQQMNDLQTTMAEVQEKFKTGQISEAQYIELMQDLSDRAKETGISLYELSEQIVGRFSEALEGANEILDNTIDKFEHLRELSDSVINLMKLTYGEEAYKKLDPMLKNQEEIAKNQLSATRKIYYEAGEWLESKRLAYEAVKGQGDQEEDAAKRMYDEALDNYNERQSQYYEALTAAAEAAMAVYENSVNKSLQDYENKLTNGLGFDALQQQLDHLQEMDELYLTNENQQYRTQKLIRTALGEMDKTANKVAKNKIELFIKQTQELQKQGKLSEYQMSIKEKEYNILLAQLALEDAQNNKSQVRLQRDSEGNFNYVYTADEDKLLEKQQEVDDAINDLYNYEREMVNEMNQRAVDSARESGEQLREIAEQYGIDSKEYIEAEQRLLAEHGEVITAIKEHITITQNSIDQSYLDSYNLIIDDEIAITDNWKNTFIETSDEIKSASQVLQKDTNSYMNEMNNDYIKVKDTSNDLRKEVSTNLNQISPIMNKVALDTSYWAMNMNEYLGSVAAAYENIANACATAAHTISGYMPDIDYAREFINETDMNKMRILLSTRQYITENNIDGRGTWGMNTEGALDLFDNINYAEVIQNTAIQGLQDTMAINAVANAAAHRIIKMQTSGDYYSGTDETEKLLKKTFGDGDIFNAIVDAMKENNHFIGFDTGGYTGDFGPEGKFAILHEKELVLNQQDTQNLLDTVDIVDKLLNSLEYQNLLYDFNISNIGDGINRNKDTLEQDVTIHAEFPNVQDHNEIEMALSNLVNTASQYANRKKS